jgi:transcriptional regulator with XRE-family HTH domain
MSTSGTESHRDYARWRARQIAYGRWEPWADAAPVREHVRRLRATGASKETIARAAGVSPMTIYRLQRDEPSNGRPRLDRIRAAQARRLLAVTPDKLTSTVPRRDATGTRRRLQALVAMGHSAASSARHLGVPPRKTWDIIRGTRATVSPEMHAAVCDLYERLWDLCPPERTAAERRAATSARAEPPPKDGPLQWAWMTTRSMTPPTNHARPGVPPPALESPPLPLLLFTWHTRTICLNPLATWKQRQRDDNVTIICARKYLRWSVSYEPVISSL